MFLTRYYSFEKATQTDNEDVTSVPAYFTKMHIFIITSPS